MQDTREGKGENTRLRPKQQVFVNKLLEGKNQTQAYQIAYAGVKYETAMVNGSKLLRNTKVSEHLERRRQRALANAQVTDDEVLGSAVFNMRTSIDDCLDADGRFDIEKARNNGSIDVVSDIEIIETQKKNGDKEIRHKIKLESPAAARKEVANYIGIERMPGDRNIENIIDIFAQAIQRDKDFYNEHPNAIPREADYYPQMIAQALSQNNIAGDAIEVFAKAEARLGEPPD